MPPLTTTGEEIDRVVDVLSESIRAVRAEDVG
jgi:adenosylmethionine-8-amino-7-oxononanoate aminotransferase